VSTPVSGPVPGGYAGGDVLAEVVRSGFTEGYHRGSVVVLDPAGVAVSVAGDVTAPVFPRSANKPMQAAAMLAAGLDLADPADLALACASHYGEPAHVRRVRAMLAAGGLSEADLRCPADLPLAVDARDDLVRARVAPAPVYMNCSGKHAAMLLTCRAAGWPTDGYLRAEHPAQVAIRAGVQRLVRQEAAAVGVDGCGAPVLAFSLVALAGAVQAVAEAPAGTPAGRVADAMRAYPELGSGTGGDDARLMRAVPGLLAKGGAEGVHAVAVPGIGAVALKIDDGTFRARLPVLVSALARLGLTGPALDALAEVPVLGGGQPVGRVRAVW